jgi:biopolymer transport protein TolR
MRKAEINVTPLIDILLVMLVIFIATVTLKQQAIESTLPAETQTPSASLPPEQIMIEVGADRHLSVNSQAIERSDLASFLRGVYDQRGDKTLYVAAAGSLPYGAVIDVMDTAKGAGVQRFGIVTEGMRRAAGVRPE